MPLSAEGLLSPAERRRTLIYTHLPEEKGSETPQEALEAFYSPWLSMNCRGSYFYKGEWERIDHFFLSSALFDGEGWEWFSARVINEPWMLTRTGTPRGGMQKRGRDSQITFPFY